MKGISLMLEKFIIIIELVKTNYKGRDACAQRPIGEERRKLMTKRSIEG